jgi:hypothetical protein
VARPSIVPIALTLDDRTGYTLWAPPWEEDGEEWQAFLGTTVEDGGAGSRATVHLFPSPAALAAFCRTATDHDLADHPVWPVVVSLGAEDLTPDDDHRYDLDGVYDTAAEPPDRWAVDELAATVDMVGRLAECLDTSADADEDDVVADEEEGQFEAVAELVAKPEIGSLGLGVDAFAGRSGDQAWAGVGRALDELWEDVVEELGEHLDWTGAGTVTLEDYPVAADEDEDLADIADDDDALEEAAGTRRPAAGATAVAAGAATAGVSTIRGNSRFTASPAEVAAAARFWESVGILPVEIVVPDGAGLTLRCYVEDEARFLGRDGEIFLFSTPADLARFCGGRERHDLSEIASWPEVAGTDTLPLPAEEDRYDLTELAEVLTEVVDGAAGLVAHRVLAQPVEGVRDIAEYARLTRVDQLLSSGTALARAVARSEREPDLPLEAAEAAAVRTEWDEVVTAVSGALVFRD